MYKFIISALLLCLIFNPAPSQTQTLTFTTNDDTLIDAATQKAENCNPRCSKYGYCTSRSKTNETSGEKYTEYYCLCDSLYEGETCSQRWREDATWYRLFIAYQVFTVVFTFVALAWSVLELIITLWFANTKGWTKWSVVTQGLIFVALGTSVRLVMWIADPHAERQVMGTIAYSIMYALPIVLWLAGGFSLYLYWVELYLRTGIQQILYVKKLQPILYGLIVAAILAIFPCAIANAVKNTSLTIYLYNGFLIVFFLIFIGIAVTFGFRLRRQLLQAYENTRVKTYKPFLLKLTIVLYGMSALFVAAIISAILFALIANNSKYPYVIIHWLFRTEEFGEIFFLLYLFHKRLPNINEWSKSGRSGGISGGGENTSGGENTAEREGDASLRIVHSSESVNMELTIVDSVESATSGDKTPIP